MPWQPVQVWPMTEPRSASPASVIGISGGGGDAGGALLWAKAPVLRAQVKTANAATIERNTGTGSWEIPFSTARILAKTSPRWQAKRIAAGPLGPSGHRDLYLFRGRKQVAGHAALGTAVDDGAQLGRHAATNVHDFRAARREPATRSDVDRRRDLALDRDGLAGALRARVGQRIGGDEDLRVRMLGAEVHVVGRADLDERPQIHHGHAIRNVANHRQVVRNE